MKKAIAIVLAVLLCFSLCACSDGGGGNDNPGDKKSAAIAVRFEIVNVPDSASQYALITGYDQQSGDTIWTYQTDNYYVGQVETLQEIGLSIAGYYFIAQGTVYCLDFMNGEVLWTNDDFAGAGAAIDIDMYGTIYLGGYFSPDLYIIDAYGKTVGRYEALTTGYGELDGQCFWVFDVKATDNGVAVSYESNNVTVLVDPNTGDILDYYPHVENVTEEFLVGSWLDDKYDTNIILSVDPDMSYSLVRYGEDGEIAAIYYGTLELDKLYTEGDGLEGGDWIKFNMSETTDAALQGWSNIGDYIVCRTYVTENYCYIDLAQVNNGDSMISVYYNVYSFALEKIEAMG